MMGAVIGLTGLIGTGKSAVAGVLKSLNCAVFDADAYVHQLYENKEVQQKLEASVFKTSSRTKIAEMLQQNPVHKKQLEAILHPLVRDAEHEFVDTHIGKQHVVLDIPLLFETEADLLCDAVWVTHCRPEIQRERVLARPGYTEERFKQILAWQGDGKEKRERADLVIDTEKSLETLKKELAEELKNLDA